MLILLTAVSDYRLSMRQCLMFMLVRAVLGGQAASTRAGWAPSGYGPHKAAQSGALSSSGRHGFRRHRGYISPQAIASPSIEVQGLALGPIMTWTRYRRVQIVMRYTWSFAWVPTRSTFSHSQLLSGVLAPILSALLG